MSNTDAPPAEDGSTHAPKLPVPATAAELKNVANTAFSHGELEKAIILYQHAIDAAIKEEGGKDTELLGILHCNKAIANFNAGAYKQSVADATTAVQYRPTWVKAFHRRAMGLAALGQFAEATEVYKEAVVLEPDTKWLKTALKKMQKQVEDSPVKDEFDWMEKYKTLSPQPIRMAVLVHYWNICTKPERYAALSRLSELSQYRFALNEELMAELPLERYKDIAIPENWLSFFRRINTKRKVNVLESMWNDSNNTEKHLIMHDLMFYFKDTAANDPGNDSGDEGEAGGVEGSHPHSHAHSHGHGHSHGGEHAHAHGDPAHPFNPNASDTIIDVEHELRRARLEAESAAHGHSHGGVPCHGHGHSHGGAGH